MCELALRSAMARVFPPGAAQQSRILLRAQLELRRVASFVLNHTPAGSESGGLGDVPVLHTPCGSEESSGNEFDSFGAELVFCIG